MIELIYLKGVNHEEICTNRERDIERNLTLEGGVNLRLKAASESGMGL